MADKPKRTRAERKQIEAVIRKYRGDGKPHTAQDTIPYQIMYPDGICYLGNRRYSQSIEFFDINYLLAQSDDQTAIFEYLCDLYNYLDSSIHVQFTYPNRKSDREQLARSFEMPPCNDGLDPIRQEQTDILKRQLARGNNGSVKTKYITYTIEADNLKAARARLSRISLDIQGYFKIMGAVSRVLDGKERLEVLHGIMHPDGERFNFDWKWLAAGGLSTKDFIAPSSFAFKNSRMFQMGGKLCAASFLQIITPELTDRILTDFLDTDSSLVVNVHIQALEQTEAVKMVKRKITDLDAMKIQEQKKAVRDGYDMDILPSDLATYGGAAKKLLQDLQSRNERYFLLTFLVLNYGDTKRKLENDVFRTAGVAQKHNCTLTRLDFQQERGLVSSLPLGENQIHITRGMTTSTVAIIVPFVTQELFQGGDSLYYGLNAKSGNMIMLDRKNARSPNGLVFGTPGGGKSFSCKREMIGVLLKTHDHVLVCDPEGEYAPLVEAMGNLGSVIRVSAGGKDRLNAMYMVDGYGENNPIVEKSQFIMSLVEQIVLVPSHSLQFLVFVLYLALLGLHHLTLRALIGRIFAYKSQTAVHLGEVLCTEDKHQLILYGAVARHISHRLYILSLAVLKLLFERGELIFQHAYVAVYMRDIFLYVFNRLLSLVDFAVYHHQIVEPFLNIGLIGTQKPLLLLNLALYACTLSAQSLD